MKTTIQENPLGDDLTVKIAKEQCVKVWDSIPLEELQQMDKKMSVLCEERRKDKSRDYPLTEQERNTWDKIRFFTTKREHENDKVNLNDCFHTSWGYDQTNIEMYKVVGFTKSGKSAIIRQIGMKSISKEGFSSMSDHVMPDPDCELKRKIWDETKNPSYQGESKENKPDLKVRIDRSSSWNPITKQHETIGEINLRGSVYYADESKHLQNLYAIKKDESTYRSWYA